MPKHKGATPKKSHDGIPLFTMGAIGIVLTVGIAVLVYLLNPFSESKADVASQTASTVQPSSASVSVASQPNEYEFYDLLKQQQVSGVPNQAMTNSSVPINTQPDVIVTGNGKRHTQSKTKSNVTSSSNPTDKGNTTYILQINSFDNADDADKRRIEVLMAGVDAQIVKKKLRGDRIIYQVISRPMSSSQMAGQAQNRLQNSGIDSLIVEQRRK